MSGTELRDILIGAQIKSSKLPSSTAVYFVRQVNPRENHDEFAAEELKQDGSHDTHKKPIRFNIGGSDKSILTLRRQDIQVVNTVEDRYP